MEGSTNDEDPSVKEKCLSDARAQFNHFVDLINEVSSSSSSSDITEPSDSVKLELYGLFKVIRHSNEIPSAEDRPSVFAIVKRAKFDAWFSAWQEFSSSSSSSKNNGLERAMHRYVNAVSEYFESVGLYSRDELDAMKKKAIEETSGTQSDDNGSVVVKQSQTTPQEPRKLQHNNIILKSCLPRPVVARGTLDISYKDTILHGLFPSVLPMMLYNKLFHPAKLNRHQYFQKEIESLWLKSYCPKSRDRGEVLTGLSVRSLFDLYLQCKQYPTGSEVIVTPPLNIKGMIDLLIHYDLKVKLIDCSSEEMEISLDSIESNISDKTVAILAVHPFGLFTASKEKMKRLSGICASRNIDLILDCAESFYSSEISEEINQYASCVFYSFGMIKTNSALGGGLVYFPCTEEEKNKDTIHKMKQLNKLRAMQYQHQQQDTEFAKKCIKALLLKLGSDSIILCGIVVFLTKLFGVDFGDFITSCVKMFPSDQKAQKDQQIPTSVLDQLRRVPSTGLFTLLLHKLNNFSERDVKERQAKCEFAVEYMRSKGMLATDDGGRVKIPSISGSIAEKENNHLYWLFPICVQDPDKVSKIMLKYGYDVPRGTSQLNSVEKFISTTEDMQITKMMNSVLYLPIANKYKSMTHEQIRHMLDALDWATFQCCNDMKEQESFQKTKTKKKNSSIMALYLSTFIFFVSFLYTSVNHGVATPLYFISLLCYTMLKWFIIFYTSEVVIVTLLRIKFAPGYLHESDTFAKYSSILHHAKRRYLQQNVQEADSSIENDADLSSPHDEDKIDERLLKNMQCLQIPDLSTRNDYDKPHAFVTGTTGFIGSLLLRELLLKSEKLGLAGVIILCRSKRQKSGYERIMSQLKEDSLFSFLTDKHLDMIKVVEGEINKPNLALSEEQMQNLKSINVTHLFHAAASVSFVQPLEDAAESIITSSLQMQIFASSAFLAPAKYVHFSTAFVYGDCLSKKFVPEELFDFVGYDAHDLYKSMVSGTQSLAWSAYHQFKFPNTYTFAKSICEHLLLKGVNGKNTLIIRPSIVGPSLLYPYEGWCGTKPSTLVAAACLYLKYQWSVWCFGKLNVTVIPVDVVVLFTLHKAFADDDSMNNHSRHTSDPLTTRDDSSDDDALVIDSISPSPKSDRLPRKRIYNVTWDHQAISEQPQTSFQWWDLAKVITHTARVREYCGSFTAYVTLYIAHNIVVPSTTKELYEKLHNIFVRTPYHLVIGICKLLGFTKAKKQLQRFGPFLDLPLLFFHFCNNSFAFESELKPPPEMNGERYMMSCMLAAETFMAKILRKQKEPSKPVIQIAGSTVKSGNDFWWALTQPNGGFFIRIAGYILIKLFRLVCSEVTVDLDSFRSLSRMGLKKANSEGKEEIHIVLAPTHRSFFDFLILSFMCFCIPELNIDLPYIAAANDFESLPILGMFAKYSRAFFLRRGNNGRIDPNLQKQVEKIKSKSTDTVFEVFIEGKRSRDRRFCKPKTGMLKCLQNSGGKHIIVPVTINYEMIPEQLNLATEVSTNGFKRSSVSLNGLFVWLKRVYTKKVHIGKIHIQVSSNEVELPPLSSSVASHNMDEVVKRIQSLQKKIVTVSDYHIHAGSRMLNIKPETIKSALRQSDNCYFWPQTSAPPSTFNTNIISTDEIWSTFLQYGHCFAPYLIETHPSFSKWLDPTVERQNQKEGTSPSSELSAVLDALCGKFEQAEIAVQKTIKKLELSGFSSPSKSHVLQYVRETRGEGEQIPTLLVFAIYSKMNENYDFDSSGSYSSNSSASSLEEKRLIKPLFRKSSQQQRGSEKIDEEEEAFGAWGFEDSRFVLSLENTSKTSPTRIVTMKGSRYTVSGRRLPKIVNFLEKEMEVRVDPQKIALPMATKDHYEEEESLTLSSCDSIPPSDIKGDDIEELRNLSKDENDSCTGLLKISTKATDRIRHGTGHTQEDMYRIRTKSFTDFRLPDVVVWPSTEEQILLLVTKATEKQWCLIPFGGGTNVTQATWCPPKDMEPRPIISVDMKLLNKVISINEEDGVAHVQAGITGRALVKEFAKIGYTIGHEPDSIEFSTLGGWIATKASGMKQNKYGNIEDIVLDVRVVSGHGNSSDKALMWQHSMNDDSPCAFERVSTGLDLKSLIIGSEGSLGIITSALIKIWPLPQCKEYDSVILPSFDTGIDFMREVSRMRSLKPASIRMVDNEQFRLAQALKGGTSNSMQQKMKDILTSYVMARSNLSMDKIVAITITYEGTAAEVKAQMLMISQLTKKYCGLSAGSKVGRSGYDLTFAIAYLRDFAMTYYFLGESFETFCPWSKVRNLVQKTKDFTLNEHKSRLLPGKPIISARITQLYDTGVCVYFYFCMNFENVPNPSEVFGEIEHAIREEILKNGGSLSHHHGVGKLRAPFMKQINSKCLQKTLEGTKKSLDPSNIFAASNGAFS